MPWQTLLPDALREFIQFFQAWREIRRRGLEYPFPPFIKAGLLRREASAYGGDVLIETGTFFGDTAAALADQFKEVYSIEVEPRLHRRAMRRFRGQPGVHVVLGDSATALPKILAALPRDRKAMFWLDGHYSGGFTGRGQQDCPVLDEMRAIAASGLRGPLVLIDDARCFGKLPGYPPLDEVCALARELFPEAAVGVENDVIAVRPR